MALYPSAEWRPLAAGDSGEKMSTHDVVCLHTMAGFLAGTEAMFRQNGWTGTESHFGVGGPADAGKDGVVYQWVDTDFAADANLQGNPRLISIETSDGGDETNPWSPAQLDAIIGILVWCCREYSIPAELIADSAPGRRGIGYHRQGIDPWRVAEGELWSKAQGKVCPGDTRISQLIDDVVPRVQQLLSTGPAAPVLHLVSPDRGAGGTQVVLSGSGFSEATSVWFGDVPVETWTVDDDSRITATVPDPLTSGSVPVVVASPDATSEAVSFAYEEASPQALALWSVVPDTGTAGSEVLLFGSGLLEANGVSFGGVWVETWTIDDDSQITATVPEPISSGGVWVAVSSPGAWSESLLFTYDP